MIALLTGIVGGAVVVLVSHRVIRPVRVPPPTLGSLPSGKAVDGSPAESNGQVRVGARRLSVDWLVQPPTLCAAVVLAPWTSGLSLMVPVLGFAGRAARVRAQRQKEKQITNEVIEALPDVIDLLLLAAGTGLVLRDAIAEVASVGRTGPLDDALVQAFAAGSDRSALADELADELGCLGEPVRPLASVLTGGLRYGSPVVAPLERLVDDARLARRRRVETQARRLPVLLLLPLVICGLPSFILLAVVPVALSALEHLSP